MSKLTDFLKLHIWQIPDDNEQTFDYVKAIAENFEKIDINANEANTNISNLQAENETNKSKIEEIENKNTEQDTNIQNNASNIEALKAKHTQEISSLENLIPTGQASGESIDLNDSAEYKFKKFLISGNSVQETNETMPSPDYPSEIKNIDGNIGFKVEGKNRFDGKFEIAEYDSSGNKATTTVWAVNKNIINVKPNTTYTVSQKETPTQYRIICFNNNEFLQWITSTQDLTNGYKSYTFTTPENCNKIYIQFRSTLEVMATGTYEMTTDSITEAQLEEGELTQYEPYKSQVVTFPLGEEKLMEGSYLADDGIHHKRKQIVLDGTEGYINQAQGIDSIFYTAFKVQDMRENSELLCSHFRNSKNIEDVKMNIGIGALYENYIYFGIDVETIGATADMTLAQKAEKWKSYLAEQKANGTPIVIEYYLAEEEIVLYTGEQREAYNKIKELYSYKGTTHITCENELSCIFQIGYYKDLETILNNMQAQILAE